MSSAFKKIPSFFTLGMMLTLSLLVGCLSGHSSDTAPVQEYDGVGLRQTNPQATTISGTIKFLGYQGGDIQIEARAAVPCRYEHCPVIGDPSLASMTLHAPGDYQLALNESAKNLMVIAIYQSNHVGTRIAHTWIDREEKEISGIDLSLDRPYPPLR